MQIPPPTSWSLTGERGRDLRAVRVLLLVLLVVLGVAVLAWFLFFDSYAPTGPAPYP